MDPNLYNAGMHVINPHAMVADPGDDGPKKKLDPTLRPEWNNFIKFLEAKKMRGSSALDDRNKGLGKQLMGEYLKANPNSKLTYDAVPLVQQDLQDYRQQALQKIKAGGATVDGMTSDDQFMPGLSPVDGWLGSKTSDHLFPTGSFTNQNTGVKKDFGTDVEVYDKMIGALKKKP